MKRILSFLLCIILLKAQAFAIHGNLAGTDSGTFITGTYSGTMIPEDLSEGTRTFDENGDETGIINSVGLFSVGMPDTGIGQGGFIIFTDGRSYSGSITAVGDPGEGSITGILEATYSFTELAYDRNGDIIYELDGTTGSITPSTTTVTTAIRGSINADVASTLSGITATAAAQANYGRISGTAITARVGLSDEGGGALIADNRIAYKVDGVKQSLQANTTNPFEASTDDGFFFILF